MINRTLQMVSSDGFEPTARTQWAARDYPSRGTKGVEVAESPEQSKTKLSTGEVYEELRAQILENRIPPGTRVNIEAVSRQLGVSPTPVREALHRLQGDNLVVATSGRGYSTTTLLDLSALRDLFEFRLLVEPWAARSAAVDRLEKAALVARSPHPTDGRTTLIELTAEGRTLAKKATAALNAEGFGKSGCGPDDVDPLQRPEQADEDDHDTRDDPERLLHAATQPRST